MALNYFKVHKLLFAICVSDSQATKVAVRCLKEIADCYVVHTNRCFYKKQMLLKHLALIMLHDYLHCLVFKEQSCLALLSKCPSLQATHLSYRIGFDLSRIFWNFLFYQNSKAITYNPLPVKACWTVFFALVPGDLYYITRVSPVCQHFFLKK